MKNWKLLLCLSVVFGAIVMIPFTFAADNYSAPIKNAKYVKAVGPLASGNTPYGTMTVVTQDDVCYEYLTDKGQYIKYKRCDEDQWIEIKHNFIRK